MNRDRTAEALELFTATEKLQEKLREAAHMAEGLRAQVSRIHLGLPVQIEPSNLNDVADLMEELVKLLRFAVAIRQGPAAP